MRDDNNEQEVSLQQECRMFTRYLTHREADSYVVQKYVECHAAIFRDTTILLPIDSALIGFARGGPFRTRIADAYARMFRPKNPLRRKLILVFAILENSRGYHQEFTSGGSDNGWTAFLEIAGSMAVFVAALSIGMIVFVPRHVLMLWRGEGQRK